MAGIKLEGFVDDGRGAPLPGIPAIVTTVDDGAIVTSGVTGSDGRWVFTGLPETDEYFVNLADGAGNAIVRGPWSGELREAWVRDRLALPDTAHAVLPNGGNTTVGGLPLVLDPDPLNVLEWRAGGIFSAGAVGLTQAAADLLYEPIDTAYTKAESDTRFVDVTGDTLTGALNFGSVTDQQIITSASTIAWLFDSAPAGQQRVIWQRRTSDAIVVQNSVTSFDLFKVTISGNAWVQGSLTAEAKAVRLSPDAGNTLEWRANGFYSDALDQAAADALFLTPAEGNAAYSTAAHTHAALYEPLDSAYTKAEADARYEPLDSAYTKAEADAAYVKLTGGSVMTGLLGPTTNNTRDLGTSALRWRSAYLSGSLNFDDAIVDPRITFYSAPYFGIGIAAGMLKYSAGVATNRHSFQVAAVERFSVSDASVIAALPVNPDANNTRDLGTTALRWRALYGMTADLTTSLTVAAKPLVISPDAANIIEWRANGFYAAAGAVSDIWVNTAGDTMTGVLTMAADIIPDLASARALGSIAKPWADLWGVNGNFEGALTVANPGSSTAVNIGPLVSASTPLIRFRSSGLASSYDSRIAGTGGTATNGQGTLTLLAATVAVTGALTAGGNAVLTQATADPLYVNTTGDTMTGDLTLSATIARLIFNETDHTANSKNTRLWVDGGIFRIQAFDDAGNGGGVSLDITRVNNNWNTFSFNGHMSLGGTALYVDASQKLAWINKLTDPALPAGYTANPGLLVQHEGAHFLGLSLARASSADPYPETLGFWRSRGTWASKVAIANGDYTSAIEHRAWSGSQWLIASAVYSTVSGTVTTTAAPGAISFNTADSAGTLATRMSIGPAGLVGVGAMADGSANATLDAKPLIASGFAGVFRAHASAPDSFPWFISMNRIGTIVFGTSAFGWATDAYVSVGATATTNFVNSYVGIYNSGGVLLGYCRLYSAAS